jgi:hypothetical protein
MEPIHKLDMFFCGLSAPFLPIHSVLSEIRISVALWGRLPGNFVVLAPDSDRKIDQTMHGANTQIGYVFQWSERAIPTYAKCAV